MTTLPANVVLKHIRTLVTAQTSDRLPDGQLLRRYTSERDEAAFGELVRRHGPLVLGVCRRVLHNLHDAEDAFQATFLVLARKAGSVRPRHMVANWLHGVAHRTALKSRVAAAKCQQREGEAVDMSATKPDNAILWSDLKSVLDEEIQRLPTRYRAAFVLCHIEGKSNDEAARQLGCSKGTIGSRLSRARERLRARLTKRGITLSTTAFVAAVTEQTASATVPSALAATILKAALTVVAGGAATGIVSTQVITLMEGVLRAMFITKLKIAASVVLALGLVVGASLTGYGALSARPTQDNTPDGPQTKERPKADDFEERRAAIELQRTLLPLMEKRLAAAKIHAKMEEFLAGRIMVDAFLEASQNLLKAQQEMSDKPIDRLKMLEMQFERMRILQQILEARFKAGKASTIEVAQARYYR